MAPLVGLPASPAGAVFALVRRRWDALGVGRTLSSGLPLPQLPFFSSLPVLEQAPASVGVPLLEPAIAAAMVAFYLTSVALGMRLIRARATPPAELRRVMIGHNILLVFVSLAMAVGTAYEAYFVLGYRVWGNPTLPPPPRGRVGDGLVFWIWVYYISKAYEWVDTWIMIARQKSGQVTFLHVYHHVSVFLFQWIFLYLWPGGDNYFEIVVNSSVHVFMYSYYLLTALGIRVPGKRYITILQLAQFALFVVHTFWLHIVPNDYPSAPAKCCFVYVASLSILFLDFFKHTYGSPPRKDAPGHPKAE